ncbi:MAG TPA: hypothetical protein VHM31_13110 [Polyangia bacterium]|nr:hypothetical protein [Polyangia bacterium]
MKKTRTFPLLCCVGALAGLATCAGVGQRAAGNGSGSGGGPGAPSGGNTGTGAQGVGNTGTGGSSTTILLPPTSRDAVDPSLPPATPQGFAGAPSPAPGSVQVVYPSPGAIIPRDLAAIDVQWNAVPGATAYRVSLSVDTGDRLTGYVTNTHYLPSAEDWGWLLSRAGGHTVQIQVQAAALDAAGTPTGPVGASTPQPLLVSRDDATGALFYFGTTGSQGTGSGTLYRLPVGKTAPAAFINGTITNGLCVGCHTLTRDGKRMSFAYDNIVNSILGNPMTLGNVDVMNPAQNQAPANTPSAAGTFNPDGSLLLTSFKGKLTLRNGTTAAPIADVATSGLAMFPDWSPDGNQIVFVRPRTACTAGGLLGNWGQDSIIVIGGALVTMDYDPAARTFSNEQVIFPSDNRSAYYPSYSPDGTWIAFTRTDGVTKSSWSGANTSCVGFDGTASNYDNPSATTWLLPVKGGAPVELATANGAPMRTNSWPKWGPRKDGEYLWLSFTSTRPYGNVLTGVNAHHQLWITAVRANHDQQLAVGDPSAPAVWFPFQDTVTKNHIGMWSVNVTTYVIP